MKKVSLKSVLLLLLLITMPFLAQAQYNTAKPWAYWWWMGSAVNEADLKANLKSYADAGFGGMHIIPIYGVKGEESKFLPFLSEEWLKMLDYTVEEAGKLGLGIDMTLGTGWPFGGPQVEKGMAAMKFDFDDKGNLITLNTGQKVKRAAPGGEGLVLDHFSKASTEKYLQNFDSVFKIKNYGVRAFYSDSYEVYDANWTSNFLEKFKSLRGYDLNDHLEVLKLKTAETDEQKRILADYHYTLSDLLLIDFTQTWVDFSHKYGKIARDEAHGSPANLLDLYAAADVPETEFFGSKPYAIPGYRMDPDYDPSRFGTPNELLMKLASSAAHVSGKSLVSSETATWLGNHFKVSLSQIKPIVDESFVAGVNHIFYHGVPYSPPSAKWPGWLFYASTNFNPQSHFANELHFLNKYVENCQQILQNSKPDNDFLLYLPIWDMWHQVGRKGKTHPIDVHSIKQGIFENGFEALLDSLRNTGYNFDFISDKQLLESDFSGEKWKTSGNASYKALLLPPMEYIPLETMQYLDKLRNKGAKIVFLGKLPGKTAGYNNYKLNDQELKDLLNQNWNVVKNLKAELPLNYLAENLADSGIKWTRKKTDEGKVYFLTNLSNVFTKGNISLNSTADFLEKYDPLKDERVLVKSLNSGNGKTEFFLNLAPGESVFLKFTNKSDLTDFEAKEKTEKAISLNKEWTVEFISGEPFIPQSYKTKELKSWTLAPDSAAKYFSGYAKYSTSFSCKACKGKTARISLGDVRETAEIFLNGKNMGTAWSLPFELEIPAGSLSENNKLEVIVRNLSANRVRYMEKEKVQWRKFYDINFVDITYTPFDAMAWKTVDSGLLGPVKILVSE